MAKSKSYVTIADRMLIDEIAKEAQKVLELAKAKGIKDFHFTCVDGRGKDEVEAINLEIDLKNLNSEIRGSRIASSGHIFNN